MRSLAAGAIALVLCACALSAAESTPAVITSTNAASRAMLQQTVSTLLGRRVTLADDALTRDSTLVVERTVARDPSGNRIEAAERSGPETIRLVRRGNECVVIHERTQNTATLSGVTCVNAR